MTEPKKPSPTKKIFSKKLIIILISVSCLFYVLLIQASIQTADRYDQMVQATDEYINCAKADTQLAAGSNYLTEQVRLYVTTLNQQNIDNYFIEVNQNRRREQALEMLLTYNPDETTYDYLQEAKEQSDQLMQREFYAMKLAAISQGIKPEELPSSLQDVPLFDEDLQLSDSAKLAKAYELVFGERYNLSKSLINNNVNQSTNNLLLVTQQQQQEALHNLHITMQQQYLLISLIFMEILLFALLFMRQNRNNQQSEPQEPEQPQA